MTPSGVWEVEEESNNAVAVPPFAMYPLVYAMLPEGPKKTHDDSRAQKKMVTRRDA